METVHALQHQRNESVKQSVRASLGRDGEIKKSRRLKRSKDRAGTRRSGVVLSMPQEAVQAGAAFRFYVGWFQVPSATDE